MTEKTADEGPIAPAPSSAPASGSAPARTAREAERAVRPLLLQYVIAFTSRFALAPVLPVLLKDGLQQPGLVVGLALFAFACSSRAGSIVLSPWLAGRSGVRLLLLANLLSGGAFALLALTSSAVPLIVLLAAGGTGVSLNGLIVRSVVAEWTSGTGSQVTAFAKLNVMLNLAASVGPLIGTALLDTSAPRRLLLVLAAGYLAAALVMLVVARRGDEGYQPDGRRRFSFREHWGLLRTSPFLRRLMVTSTIGWFLYAQLYSALPIYLFSTSDSKLQVASYFTMSAVLIVLVQVPVSKGVARLLDRGLDLMTVLFTGLALFAAAFVVLALSGGDPVVLYAAVAVFTLGEILFAPTVDSAFAAAGEASSSSFVATFTGKQITLATGESIGALIGGSVFLAVRDSLSPALYWWLCAAVTAVAVAALVTGRVRTPVRKNSPVS
ncbi:MULTISPECIES: MFS transporter [unclassified Streptomyces]|uniref:MFS transporter n=1 Tax=unclassified Streptomyces TaxID=2593676 RepID=UPI0022B67A7A|nr:MULTISPECIES: MFS transporter [unclassified Streptomyces]MCZ7413973.1 MFS transporter [Streptomyces sp. WMMC897]MCZ7430969.1 MFS transporter [Streptomyces sp. WMMC1477]